jgi:hypothetical protein
MWLKLRWLAMFAAAALLAAGPAVVEGPQAQSEPRAHGKPPNAFPKESAQERALAGQRQREILEKELATERDLLELAKRDLGEQQAGIDRQGGERSTLRPHMENMELHERNVAALRRELSQLGAGAAAAAGAAIGTNSSSRAPQPVVATEGYHGGSHDQVRVPKGHMPPPGKCRAWYPDRPPGQQPPPGDCGYLRVPPGAVLVQG